MDLRRQVSPSPNSPALVTSCQSATTASSCISPPLQTSTSIRCIKPNFVKSRAEAFERNNANVGRDLLPSKPVIGGKYCARNNASPLSVDTAEVSRRTFVQPSRSVDHLEHSEISSIPSVGLRNSRTRFISDTGRSTEAQTSVSPTHRDLLPVSAVGASRILPSEKLPDTGTVMQQLNVFENRPSTPNKPPLPPKPRSPSSDFVSRRTSVYRSKSSDSVLQPAVDSQVKSSFVWPPEDRVRTESAVTQDVFSPSPSSSRQVKENVVLSPPLSSSGLETSRNVSPKPPKKPLVRENVISPSSLSRQVKETVVVKDSTPSFSYPETSKVDVAKAPEKPPRLSAYPGTPTRGDSCRLVVCTTGDPPPSVPVRAEKLSPVVAVADDRLPQATFAKPGPDRHRTQRRGKTTCPVQESVLSTSQIQNNNTSRSNVALHSSPVSDAWEKKFIRPPKSTQVVHSRGEKENFVSQRRMNNPNYMYVSMYADDIIPSQLKKITTKQTLTRYHSDDMLNVPKSPSHKGLQNPKSPGYKEPLYSVPYEFTREAGQNPIMFDSAGYAMPSVHDSPQVKHVPKLPPKQKNFVQQSITAQQRHNIQAKVSSAYSILRLNFITPDNQSAADFIGEHESEGEIDLEEHRRHLHYVSRVKEATYKDVSNYEKVRLKCGDQRLFEYAMIVTLQPSDEGLQPRVLFCFPHEISSSDQLASQFCFPEAADELQPVSSYRGESFSFLLTSSSGGRRYGWCYRYLPPGDGPRLLEALVIVTQIGERNLYRQLLDKVRTCRFLSLTSAEEMLQVAYARPFPEPNKEVYIRTVGPDYSKLTFIIKRDAETPYNNVSFTTLLSHLSIENLLQVFAALLLERKLIFCSRHLSTLSTCMSTVVALLYPFEWQHTCITVLPSKLIDIVDAPTPYLVGILTSTKELLGDHYLTEVLFVDLDAGRLQSMVGDEGRIIPKKIQRALIAALSDDSDGSGASAVSGEATVAEAFLRMFVETCGHYDTYINTQQNGERIFQRELFTKVVSSHSIRMFLEWFTLTQMFDVFITDRLKDDFMPGYFENRVMDYRDEMKQLTNPLRENMKVFGKKIVGFLRDYGGKIKKSLQDVYV